MIKNGVATWQAYNTWGGYDLYNGPGGEYGNRALAVSLDRPYDQEGAYLFLIYERKLINLAERMGLPLAYADQHGHRRRPAPAGRRQRADLARARRVLVAARAGPRHRGPGRGGQPGVPRRQRDVPAHPARPDEAGRRRLVICYKTSYL